jgi:hypothetical protein
VNDDPLFLAAMTDIVLGTIARYRSGQPLEIGIGDCGLGIRD